MILLEKKKLQVTTRGPDAAVILSVTFRLKFGFCVDFGRPYTDRLPIFGELTLKGLRLGYQGRVGCDLHVLSTRQEVVREGNAFLSLHR